MLYKLKYELDLIKRDSIRKWIIKETKKQKTYGYNYEKMNRIKKFILYLNMNF